MKRYRDWKMRGKVMLVLLIALGVMLLFDLFMIKIITGVYNERLYQNSVLELQYLSHAVENEMAKVESLSFEIAMDREFQNQLYDMKNAEDKQLEWLAMVSFKDKLNVESVRNDRIRDIIYDNKKDIKYEVLSSGKEIPMELYQELLEKTSAAHGGVAYALPTENFPYILVGRDIRERINSSLDYLGTLVISYDIWEIIDESSDGLNGLENNLCVYEGTNMIYNNNEDLFQTVPSTNGESGYDIVIENGKKYLRCYSKSAKTGWMYVNEYTYESIYTTIVLTIRVLVISMLALAVLLVFLVRRICTVITDPLDNLAESMKIVEKGDFERARQVLILTQRQDEAGILSQEFDIMLEKITVLIRENYEKQITLMDSRYKALQAQINPHFLYNTLNSIGWMIKANRNEEAQKMIIALGMQLRAAFSEESVTTLAEEVRLLEQYIFIQQIRYQDRVKFAVEIEDAIYDCRIPRLSLQPLVENALSHGVEECLRDCTISVCAVKEKDGVRICVTDTGAGMSGERLQEVRNGTAIPKQNGIGLKNIRQRLELIYGLKYEFKIDSKQNEGTQITIRIPWEG